MPYDFLTEEEQKHFENEKIAKRGELRRLRIFISHRWDQHAEVYKQIERELTGVFGTIQNLSIPEQKKLTGSRGGHIEDYKLKSEMAARIYTSDVILSPSNVGMGTNLSTRFEVEMAAVAYSVPIVFVRTPSQIRSASFVRRANEIGIKSKIAHLGTDEIVSAVRSYVDDATLRQQFPISTAMTEFAQRGPKHEILDKVLREFPYLEFKGKLSAFDSPSEIESRALRRRSRFRIWRR